MNRLLITTLSLSLGLNVFLLYKKIKAIQLSKAREQLLFYNNTTPAEGTGQLRDKMNSAYPKTSLRNKYLIVYRWDSLLYDDIYSRQMHILDSMAAGFGQYTFEYVLVTEMEEQAAKDFLQRNAAGYKHVKMLYGMHNYISGLHNSPQLQLSPPKVITLHKHKEGHSNLKRGNLYLITDAGGQILYTSGHTYHLLKDSAFFSRLHQLLPTRDIKTLN